MGIKVCLIKIPSKHSSNTLLSLLRFFIRQTLVRYTVLPYNDVLQYKCRSDVLQIKEMSHQLMAVLYDENKFF